MTNPYERSSFGVARFCAPKSLRKVTARSAVVKLLFFAILLTNGNAVGQVINPTQAGSIEQGFGLTPNLTGATAVDVKGNYAYTVGIGDVLQILDITLPGLPINKGSLTNGQGGASILRPQKIMVQGNYAYISSNGGDALEIVDVSDPAHPVHKSVIRDGRGNVPHLDGVFGFDIAGNYAYVASGLSNALEIIDISNPAAPVHKGAVLHEGDADGPHMSQPVSVAVHGNVAYVGTVEGSIEIIDVSNPALPQHVGRVLNAGGGNPPFLASSYNIRIRGNYAYIPNFNQRLVEILDISDPIAPVHASVIKTGASSTTPPLLYGAWDIAFSGDHAFVVGSWDKFEVINIADPTMPTHVTGFASPALSNARTIKIVGQYAYVPSRTNNSLSLIDISNPAAPTFKSTTNTPVGGALLETAWAMVLDGNYAYVANNANGLVGTVGFEIVDVTKPSLPVHTGSLRNTQGVFTGMLRGLIKKDNSIYAVGQSQVAIIDVTFPTQPSQKGVYFIENRNPPPNPADDPGPGGTGIARDSGVPMLYVTCYNYNSVELVNISDPANPQQQNFYLQDGPVASSGFAPNLKKPTSIQVRKVNNDDIGYVTSYGSDALTILNMQGGVITYMSSIVDGEGGAKLKKPWHSFVSGNYAYVASFGSSALEIVDVSNPNAPVHKGALQSPLLDSINHVFVSGNYAYVTCAETHPISGVQVNGRMVVIDVSDPANPLYYTTFTNGTGGALLDYPTSVTVRDGYAYVTNAGAIWALNTIYLYGPSITSYSPLSAIVGDTVTVQGTNFTTFISAQISGRDSEILEVNENAMKLRIPQGATNGQIALKYEGQTFNSGANFIVIPHPTGPTETSQTSFKAHWTNVASATYFLDVSADNFNTFVAGYDSLPIQSINFQEVAGLTPGTTYKYRVRSSDGIIVSDTSYNYMVTTIPATPNLRTTTGVTQSSFNLSWDPVPGSTGYFLDVATDNTFTTFLQGLNNLSVPSTTQAVSAAAGTTYYYRVRSTNATGTSPSSAINSVTTIPANPTSKAANAITTSGFTSNWEAVPGTTEYRFDVSADNFNTFVSGYESIGVGTALTKTLTGLSSGTTYQYRVRATNASGTSGNSGVISVITLPAEPVLQPATAPSSNSFTVSWSAVVGATSYSVDVATDNGFLALIYNNVSVNNQTSYTSGSLSPNTAYYVRVRANTTSGSSANSNVISASTLSAQPTSQSGGIVFSGVTDTSITLNYTPGNGASHLVLVNANTSLSSLPLNGVSYSGQTSYGQGTALGSGFAISNGAGPITITGLLPATTYYFHVYDFNGSAGAENYLTTTNFTNPLGKSTVATVPTSQPTGMTFTNASANSVTVSFTAASSNPSGYLVFRSPDTQPLAVPVNGVAYTTGAVVGASTVAHAGPSVSFFDGGLPTSKTYHYSVYSFNGSGASTSYATVSPLPGQITLDVLAPVITAPAIPNPTTITSGNTLLNITINDNIGVSSAKIFYRGISQKLYRNAPLTGPITGGNFTVPVQTTWYDSLGIEYYFWAADQKGNESSTAATTQIAQLLMSSFSVPSLPSGIDETSYRIITFPYKLTPDNKVPSVLSGPAWGDDTKAAMWWWDPTLNSDAGEYRQYGKANGFETMDPGKGYWVIVASSVTPQLSNVTAPKYNQSTLFPMTLKPKWNQIGNPYPVAISWDEVIAYNLTNNPGAQFSQLYTYDGTGYKKVSSLGPFKGGFVKNLGSEATIQIPFPGQASGGRTSTLGADISRDDWNISLHIGQDGRTNELGGFGMHPQAKVGEDRFDDFNPPRFLGIPEVNFTHPEKPRSTFSNDMVNSRDEFIWQFVPVGTVGKSAKLTWNAAITANTDKQLFLLDEEQLTVIDMSGATEYDFVISASSRFRIFYGRDVQRKITTSGIVAGHAYPNPLTHEASATINVALPESGSAYNVNLQVYNAQGSLIGSLHRQLPPGIHPLEFSIGNSPAAGIYIYKLAVSSDKSSAVYSGKLVKP